MYHRTSVNYSHSGGHTHVDMPAHDHNVNNVNGVSANIAFEKDDFVISINKGIMLNTELSYNQIIDDNIFLDNMCDCIISRLIGHDINLFKAGNSNELKKVILNFLKKEKNKNE